MGGDAVSAVLDAAGDLLAEQRYTPFGEARFDVALGTTDFGYTGQRALADTGLMDYNARFYAPGLGRWAQPGQFLQMEGNVCHYSVSWSGVWDCENSDIASSA
jgi:RHS repeat-associated protein